MDVSRPSSRAHDSPATLRRRHPQDASPSTPPVVSSNSASASASSSGLVSDVQDERRNAATASAGNANSETVTAPATEGANVLQASYRLSVKLLVPVLIALSLAILITTCLLAANSLRVFSLAVVACVATFFSVLLRFLINGGAPVGRGRSGRHFHRLTGERAAYVRTSQRLSMMDRDFTDADYELLLDLDNNSTRLRRFLDGASQDFIDRLPTYLYKSPAAESANEGPSNPELGGDTVRKCAICLEDFADDMKIRILPCFHRFMATCIDPWLLEQGKCPVCKAKINN